MASNFLPQRPDSPAEMAAVYDATVGAANSLVWQAHDVFSQLVMPNWGTAKHGYDRILYGVVMNIMAIVDRLSSYIHPTTSKQTDRMRLTVQALGAGELEARIVIQLWRHTLMHTGTPMSIIVDGRPYSYLLHWGEPHLPTNEHLKLVPQHAPQVLNFGAIPAAENLLALASSHFAEWMASDMKIAEIVGIEVQMRQRQSC